jgi:hypothetical protein
MRISFLVLEYFGYERFVSRLTKAELVFFRAQYARICYEIPYPHQSSDERQQHPNAREHGEKARQIVAGSSGDFAHSLASLRLLNALV